MINNKLNNESLAKTVKDLMFKEPFYGLFLLSLNKEWDGNIPTAGVGRTNVNYHLKINPEFWAELSPKHKVGLLKHELMHIAFCHVTDFQHLNGPNNRYARIANMAMDIEINQYIDSDYLPEGGLLPSSFPELNLEPKKGTRYYFDKLMEEMKNGCDAIDSILQAVAEAEAGEGIPQGGLKVKLPDGQTVTINDHDWSEIQDADEGTQKVLKAQAVRAMNEAASQTKARGVVPGEISQLLDQLNFSEPPKFDWRGYIKRFSGKSVKIFTKKSRRKYNKRYIENPGLKIKQRKHILVAIDTSGSVSNDELREFMQEIYHLYKTGNEVTLVHADTAISKIEKFNPKSQYEIFGRGGTDFNPVVDYFEENRKKYSCLIYFTDGEAPRPKNGKSDLLWVLSERSQMNDDLPGLVIQIN
jgi:predicted metal-dependent peptidase